MKVIFLDFDGVLNSSNYSATLFEAGRPTKDEYGQELFDPETVNLLNRIVDGQVFITCCEDSRIAVISSSWRYLGITALRDMWQERGLHGHIIGMTSMHAVDEYIMEHGLDWLDKGAIASSPRAMEIEAWLHEHDNVDSFVILDDMPMSASLQPHFVQINPILGLLRAQAEKAVEILNTK